MTFEKKLKVKSHSTVHNNPHALSSYEKKLKLSAFANEIHVCKQLAYDARENRAKEMLTVNRPSRRCLEKANAA